MRVLALVLLMANNAMAVQPGYAVIHTSDGYRGCGVLVSPDTVLTAWHVLRDGGQPTCQFPAVGVAARGRLIGYDSVNDLAAVRISPVDISPMPLADTVPSVGDTVWLEGRPSGSGDRVTQCRVQPYRWRASQDGEYLLNWSPGAMSGESGGPVYTADGLVGILSASDYAGGVGAHVGTIRKRLMQWCPTSQWVANSVAGQSQRQIYSAPPITSPIPSPKSTAPAFRIDYAKLAAEIVKAGGRGPAGPAGKDGEPGPAGNDGADGQEGPAGSPGRDAEIDLDIITTAVMERLPPITVHIMGKDSPAQIQTVRLGETIMIPPVIMSKTEDGQTFWQVKPLGEAIRLELVPR